MSHRKYNFFYPLFSFFNIPCGSLLVVANDYLGMSPVQCSLSLPLPLSLSHAIASCSRSS